MKNGWPTVALGEVLQPVVRGETPQPGKLYRQLGVRLWGEGAYAREAIDGSETRYPTFSRVEADDVVVNKIWARNGSVAVVREELAGYYVSTEFPTFAPRPDRLEPRWMHWLTKTPGFWQQCDERARGTSGKNRIRPEQFLQVEIPLPALGEQRRIVARIEQLAAQIEEARRLRYKAAEETEALRRHAIDAALSHSSLAREPLERFLAEPLINGLSIPKASIGSGITFAKVGVVNTGKFNAEETKQVDVNLSADSPYWLKRGDIVVSRGNTSDLVGRAAVYEGRPPKCAFADLLIRIRVKRDEVEPRFLAAFFHSSEARTYIESQIIGSSSTMPKISQPKLRAMPVPSLPLTEQRRIVGYLDGLAGKVAALARLQSETASELDALLPSILDKAFKGEL
jgi:type I restriction enzyme S subunit